MITLLILVILFFLFSTLDFCLAREGWFLLDIKDFDQGMKLLDKLKESSPVVKVHIECYHNNTSSSLGKGNLLTKNEKVISYTDDLEVPLTTWVDKTSWPSFEGLALQDYHVIGIDIDPVIEPNDEKTEKAIESFRNKFVEQNCHKDNEIKTWLTCEIPGLEKEQSFFMQIKAKSESSKAFNIASYLTSSILCMSCPVRTVIRRKTKLLKLKVNKTYIFEPGKNSPLPPLPTYEKSLENDIVEQDPANEQKENPNEFILSPEKEKRSSINITEKKLLQEAIQEEQTKIDKQSIDEGTKNEEGKVMHNEKMILLSDDYGERTIMISPLMQTRRDKRYLVLPVEEREDNNQGNTSLSTALVPQNTQTTYLAKQIRDQIAKQKLLETAKILCNVLEEPVTCMRENVIQNNLVSLPRLQYISEYQNNYQYREEDHTQNNTFSRDGKKIFLPGRDYYDESLTMHESELNNLERRAQLESNDVQNHTSDINEPEHESHYHNNLEDSFYFNPRERSSSCASQSRYYDNQIKNKKVNNLLQYSTLSCPAQRTNYTLEDEGDKIFHENYADDDDELNPRTSSAMNSRIEMIKDNNIDKAERHLGQRPIYPIARASPTPHKRVHYDIENESRNMRFRSKSTEPRPYYGQKMESHDGSRKNNFRRHVHYADTSFDDSSSYGYYRRYQSPSPVPAHFRGHRSRAERYRRRTRSRELPAIGQQEEDEYNA